MGGGGRGIAEDSALTFDRIIFKLADNQDNQTKFGRVHISA